VSREPEHSYVSRGGVKLRHALDAFGIPVAGMRCADFGASTGGFTDCLLQAGAASVTAIDTAYGVFAWKLRNDSRITLMERTNALFAPVPAAAAKVDLIVIDMGWTPQKLCIPAAARWLKPGGRIITLIKPHYELTNDEKSRLLKGGVLEEAEGERIAQRVLDSMPALGVRVTASTKSPLTGSKENPRGNAEWLALLEPVS
jgi:23S rRNA (cytidine1920-2'-O)/16S rRNA (cytidine1409-2'-O)-methyltransferase